MEKLAPLVWQGLHITDGAVFGNVPADLQYWPAYCCAHLFHLGADRGHATRVALYHTMLKKLNSKHHLMF